MIEIRNLTKRYNAGADPVLAMNNLSIDIPAQNLLTLLGPSGCGKTTLLRCIAGLETPDSGEIFINRKPVFSSVSRINVPPEARDFGMVFQSYAIWPHMTVYENVAFPLEVKRRPEIRNRVMEVLATVGLTSQAERYVSALSGGQQQRVAFARAIVSRPAILLLDEPLSNLDTELRQQMCREIRNLQQDLGVTAVYVTHDQLEALSLSDTIAVMRLGSFVEVGDPAQLYNRPKDEFTARFIGGANMVPVVSRAAGERMLDTPFGRLAVAEPVPAGNAALFIRPERIQVIADGDMDPTRQQNVYDARVVSRLFIGNGDDLELALEPRDIQKQSILLRCLTASDRNFTRGSVVRIYIDPNYTYVIPRAAG